MRSYDVEQNKLNQALNTLKLRLEQNNVPFTVFLYGSGVYGWNSDHAYTAPPLSDLDTIGLLPEALSFSSFTSCINNILDNPSVPCQNTYNELFTPHNLKIVRVGGAINGFPIGMHIFSEKAVRACAGVFGVNRPFGNTLPRDYKYLSKIYEETQIGPCGNRIKFNAHILADNEHTIQLGEFFSRLDASSVLKFPTVGLLADKFINSEVLHTPDSQKNTIIERIRRTFIRSCIYFDDNLSNTEIMKLLIRFPCFSASYIQMLDTLISEERARLNEQKDRVYNRKQLTKPKSE